MWDRLREYILLVLLGAVLLLSFPVEAGVSIDALEVSLPLLQSFNPAFFFSTAGESCLNPCGLILAETSVQGTKVGGIIQRHSHAWGENIGWVDFSPREAGVEVGANILSGWVRIENLGWVSLGSGRPRDGYRYSNLDRGDYGVNNDGAGKLSGWAWGETFGWISFDNITVDPRGCFSGYAYSENIGYILLNSDGPVRFAVRTDPYPWARIGGGAVIRNAGGTDCFPSVRESAVNGSAFAPSDSGGHIYFPGLCVLSGWFWDGPGQKLVFLSFRRNREVRGAGNSQRGPPGREQNPPPGSTYEEIVFNPIMFSGRVILSLEI
jgi:hypothetical protein